VTEDVLHTALIPKTVLLKLGQLHIIYRAEGTNNGYIHRGHHLRATSWSFLEKEIVHQQAARNQRKNSTGK
jgi:hypothetical protein